MLRRMRRVALAGALLLAGASVAVPTAAHADGPLSGLLGGAIDTTGGVIDDVTETTGLNQVVDPKLQADKSSVELNLSAPSANIDANATVGGDSLASADANVAPGSGTLLDAGLNTAVGGNEALASVETQASVAGGQVLDASLTSEVGGPQGLATVSADATALDGHLAEVHADATVAGDSVLDVNVSLGALGNEAVDGGVVIDPPLLPDLPAPSTPVIPEVPTSPVDPLPAIPAAPITPATAGTSASPDLSGTTPSTQPGNPGAPSTSILGAPELSRIGAATPGDTAPASAEMRPTRSFMITPSSILARSLLAPELQPIVPADLAGLVTTPAVSGPAVRSAEPGGTAPGIRFGRLGNTSAVTFFTNSTSHNAPLGVLASLALLGAALLFLAGQSERFRPPISRSYLPAVPPG